MARRPPWRNRSSTKKRKIKLRLFAGRTTAPCCFCERDMTIDYATLEHIVPASKGGGWADTNMALSCRECNKNRGLLNFEVFRTIARARAHLG